MKKIMINTMEKMIERLLLSTGINHEDVKKVTDVYMRAMYRDVGHHDIKNLPGRINALKENKINPNPNIQKISGFGGLECYDGDNGLGELCSYFVTKRSIELSKENGIGFCSVRNSNHFLSAAPYVELADEMGFLTIVMSKSPTGISLPGANKNIIGNNPFGFAAGYDQGRILFDICCAYSSFGKMKQKADKGEEVPEFWGCDANGEPTSDPNKISKSGLYMPMGEHKGFGIALLVEILTSILSEGTILDQGMEEVEFKGRYSQTAISINIQNIMDMRNYRKRNQQMVNTLKELFPNIYIPGERSTEVKEQIKEKGYFEVDDQVAEQIQCMSE